MKAIRITLLVLSCAALLAACSGGSDSANGTATANQAHQLIPSQKTTAPTAASYQNVTQELYLAYFGRPADPTGLANVEATLLAADAPTDAAGLAAAYSTNASIKALVDSFASSKEAQALYNGTSTEAFVSDVYQYLFDRAPAVSGLTYWSTAISSGSLNQAAAALAIMGASATNNSAQGQTDAQTVSNRLSFATNFTAELTAQHLASDYTGSGVASELRGFVAGITASTSESQIETDVLNCIEQLAGTSVTTGSVVLNAVAWSGTQFVAVGLGGVVETSPDGAIWTNRGSAFNPLLSASDLRSVIWHNNRFVAVGVNGGSENCPGGAVACTDVIVARTDSVLSSTDGVTWTNSVSNASSTSIPEDSELNSIVWNGSQFVAVGNGIFPSADGNVWTVNSLTGNYTGIASSGAIFVATGLSGALYSSLDGQNWTQHAETSLDLYGITWSGQQFVAVGAGVILTSPDGLTWTARSAGTSSHLYGVTWSGKVFVAVGEGVIVTSPDGVTWTPQVVN